MPEQYTFKMGRGHNICIFFSKNYILMYLFVWLTHSYVAFKLHKMYFSQHFGILLYALPAYRYFCQIINLIQRYRHLVFRLNASFVLYSWNSNTVSFTYPNFCSMGALPLQHTCIVHCLVGFRSIILSDIFYLRFPRLFFLVYWRVWRRRIALHPLL